MSLTFSEARDAAMAYIAALRGDSDQVVAAEGFQDADAYLFPWGHRQWIEEGDHNFMEVGPGPLLVDKRTGDVRMVVMLEEMDRVNAMEPATL